MPVEVELKFRAAGEEPLRRLAQTPSLADAELGPPVTYDELDRYLDTDDGRMAAARWACRLRTRAGVTRLSMKGPPEGAATTSVHRRPELEGPATDEPEPARWPASAARDLLDRLRGERALRERFRLRQRRTERPVIRAGTPLGTLSLDRVEVEADNERLGTLQAVELELHAAGPDAADAARLADLAAALAAIDGLEPERRTKLEHALDLLDRR